MLNEKSFEDSWQMIFEKWKGICRLNSFSALLQPIKVNEVQIPMSTMMRNNGMYIEGYDWIEKNEYEERVDSVVNDTANWLLFGSVANKGTLTTAQYLAEAAGENEVLAAIWLYACTSEMERKLPREWYGKIFELLSHINLAASDYLYGKGFQWHHAMRGLIPDTVFSYCFLAAFKPIKSGQIIELCAAICHHILTNYKIAHYDTIRDDNRAEKKNTSKR